MEVPARYGWNAFFESALGAYAATGHGAGDRDVAARIVAEHRGGYVIATAQGDLKASLAGRLRRAVARRTEPHPSVGDWVVAQPKDGYAVIQAVLPRKSTLSRKVAGRVASEQVIAANVDVVFVVSALQQEVNARTLERYLTLARESGAEPVVVLTKADACDDPASRRAEAEVIARGAPVHVVSSVTGEGTAALAAYFEGDRTVAVIGPSGVGKSTLINAWIGADQAVRDVRDDGKGRHTTTHRHLFVAPRGGLVVDTPGMREIALWDGESGVAETFDDLEALAATCRFRDCGHSGEPGCALAAAAKAGEIDATRIASFTKLRAELAGVKRKRADEAQASRALTSLYRRRDRS